MIKTAQDSVNTIKEAQDSIQECEGILKKIEPTVDSLELKVGYIGRLKDLLHEGREHIDNIDGFQRAIAINEVALKRYSGLDQRMEVLRSLELKSNNLSQLSYYYNGAVEAKENISRTSAEITKLSSDGESIAKLLEKLTESSQKRDTLNQLIIAIGVETDTIRSNETQADELTRELIAVEGEIGSFGYCPFCNNEIKEGEHGQCSSAGEI